MPDLEKPWTDHLEEFRRRLIVCLTVLAVFFAAGLAIHKKLLAVFTRPLQNLDAPLYFTAPAEGFLVVLKVAFFFALFAAMPFVIWQLWLFVKPGLEKQERTGVLCVFGASAILFLFGALFCYFLVLPVALKFLLGFGSAEFKPLLSVGHYSSFVGFMILAFAISFNFPLVLLGLAMAGILTAAWLRHSRKFVVLGIFILAAILTPSPDVISQLLLAAPLLLMFEITIFIISLMEKKAVTSLKSSTSEV